MADGEDKNKKPDGADKAGAGATPDLPSAQNIPAAQGLGPPIPPMGLSPMGIPSPNLPGGVMALQLGIGMQQQQNPEVVQHITTFLSHDSDNRLTALTASGERNHRFRMTALMMIAAIAGIVLCIPVVALIAET